MFDLRERFVNGSNGATETARSAILDPAYRSTSYTVDTDAEPIVIRIGSCPPMLSALLASAGATTWAFVTAYNPRSRLLDDTENESRHAQLVQVVRSGGWEYFLGEGVGDDGLWPSEKSLLVLDIPLEDARSLADRFEQSAFVFGKRRHPAQLIWSEEPV